MNVRVGLIMVSQVFSYCPMPVRTKTISPPVPDAQSEPGKCGNQQGIQIPSPGLSENPTQAVEKDQRGMKEKEKIIKKLVDHSHHVCVPVPGSGVSGRDSLY